MPVFPRFVALAALVMHVPAHADYSDHPRAPELLQRLSRDFAFTPADLEGVKQALNNAERLPQLVEREQKAPEKTETWTQYSRRIDDSRITGGVDALAQFAPWFARAEQEYGVSPAVIAGILGIETRFGRITGSVRVLDALSTQGFDHPTRQTFFFSELTEYFAFCRDFAFKPEEPKGSYAGAMGAAQFMPSNYRRLAIDFDGDGTRDLWTMPDAIGSIARYLTAYDRNRAWRRGEPLAVPAQLRGDALRKGTVVNGRQTSYRAAELKKLGIQTAVTLPADQPVGILELPLDDGGNEYWVALPNFYSVMTYNPRVFYGMAVTQLSQRIEARLQTAGESAPSAEAVD